jgi:hypothetical protein
MDMMRRIRVAIGVAVLGGAAVGLVPGSAASATVATTTVIPAIHLRHGVCSVDGGSSAVGPSIGVGAAPPTVSSHPSGVTVIWLPGLNDKTCRAVLVKGGARRAGALARAIDAARFTPHAATIMCPMDDGTVARLYFSFSHRRPTQRIDADLSGCSWITAPGRGARASSSQFRSAMTALAPPAWRPYVAASPDPSG